MPDPAPAPATDIPAETWAPVLDYMDLSPYYPDADPDITGTIARGTLYLLGASLCISGKEGCRPPLADEILSGDSTDITHAIPHLHSTPALHQKVLQHRTLGLPSLQFSDHIQLTLLWEHSRLPYLRNNEPMPWECVCGGSLAQALHTLAINHWLDITRVSKTYAHARDGPYPNATPVEGLETAIALLEEAVEVSRGPGGDPLERAKYLVHLGMLMACQYKLHPVVNGINRLLVVARMAEAVEAMDAAAAGGAIGAEGELRRKRALSMVSAFAQNAVHAEDWNREECAVLAVAAAKRGWRIVQEDYLGRKRPADDWIHGIRYASALYFAAMRSAAGEAREAYLRRAMEQAWYVHRFLQPFTSHGREHVALELVKCVDALGHYGDNGGDVAEMIGILRGLIARNLVERPREEEGASASRRWTLRRARMQIVLGTLCANKFNREGLVRYIDEGIESMEEGVALIDNPQYHGTQECQGFLAMLAVLLQRRFMVVHAVEDLHRSMEMYRRSMDFGGGTQEQSTSFFGALQNVHNTAVLHMTRFAYTNSQEDFEKALELTLHNVQLCDDAGSKIPKEDKALIYDFQAELLSIRSYMVKSGDDIIDSIRAAERAVNCTDVGGVERPARLHRLAEAILNQALYTKEEDCEQNLARCISVAEESLTLCRPNSYFYCQLAKFTGKAHLCRTMFVPLDETRLGSQSAGMLEIGEKVIEMFVRGFQSESSSIWSRFSVLSFISNVFLHKDDRFWDFYPQEDIYQMFCQGVKMLPTTGAHDLKLADHQERMRATHWIAPMTAALGIALGKPAEEALTYLEIGRGVIQSQWIDYRSDITPLRASYPALAERYHTLRCSLDADFVTIHGEIYRNSKVPSICMAEQNTLGSKRLRDAKLMTSVLSEIRACPGFERFLLPPEEKEFRAAAKHGPIIIVNVNSHVEPASAIIVHSTGITSLVLPGISYDETISKMTVVNGGITRDHYDPDFENHFEEALALRNKSMNRKLAALNLEGRIEDYNSDMRELYGWLWDKVVQPILGNLGYLSQPQGVRRGRKLPHVWWIGVGGMAGAPLHAAGHYPRLEKNAHYAGKYCISSYTSTIKALMYSRERASPTRPSQAPLKMMVVSMPTTPGHSDLQGVPQEVAKILSATEGLADVTVLESPSAETTLANIRQGSYSIMHFACHGVADAAEPSSSRLLLQKPSSSADGTAPPELDELTVKTIASVRPSEAATSQTGAALAYLSACSSADQQLQRALREEGLHIANAFQLAGFSHVIGTLWESEDEICTEVAAEFYRELLRRGEEDGGGGGGGGVGRAPAEALHAAVDRLRRSRRYWPCPWMWAPFTHWGA